MLVRSILFISMFFLNQMLFAQIINEAHPEVLKMRQNILIESEKVLSNDNSDVGKKYYAKYKEFTQNTQKYEAWDVAELLGEYKNEQKLSSDNLTIVDNVIQSVFYMKGSIAQQSNEPATVIFGTSGWRARIGEEFSVANVRKVVRSISDMMQTSDYLSKNNFASVQDLKKAGVLIFRDNRFMGDDFVEAAKKDLVAQGYKVYIANECPTGVGSALVRKLKVAGSLNFTPSHNPFSWQGLKFNPADGGPAGAEFTDVIMAFAVDYMNMTKSFENEVVISKEQESRFVRVVDAKKLFTDYLDEAKVFEMNKIRKWLKTNRNDLAIVIDNMHGSSRGYIETVLGVSLVRTLREAGAIRFLNTNDDVSFHGLRPEPSARNQAPLMKLLNSTAFADKKYKLAVALDPDADRIRFADADLDIDMNKFGAIAIATLIQEGKRAGIASTVVSSDFALEIAKQEGVPVYETAVGFKNFRPYLSNRSADVAFEESDGISFDTLEKCGIQGFLAAINAMMVYKSNLSVIFKNLQNKYGVFKSVKGDIKVNGLNTSEWDKFKKALMEVIKTTSVKVGDVFTFDGTQKTVKDVVLTDGLKVVFQDNSSFSIRPSGTEPIFKVYTETVNSTNDAINQQYIDLAKTLYNKAKDSCAGIKVQISALTR